MFFWNSLAFSVIPWMLAIWSLIPQHFLNPACTSGSSWFIYCWSLAWRILNINFGSMWDECNCAVVWAFFGIAFLWDWNENWPFPVLWPLLNFPSLHGVKFSSVQFSRSVVSDSLRPHESQHARPPCPSPTPGVYSNSCPLSQWCHPAISSSVVPFSSCPQSFPASGSFPMSQIFTWGGQSFSFSISPSNEHPGLISFKMDWLDLLAVQGTLKIFSNTTVQKHQFFGTQLSSQSNSHIHTWPLEKP